LAKKIVSQTGKSIVFVVNARGGFINRIVEKGGTDAGDRFTRIRLHEPLKPRNGEPITAILWNQGEANKTASATYPAKLTQLVDNSTYCHGPI
jgi:hypothetical protein